MMDQLDSESAPQRKRIAVACGRCRKRKIRCSGDPGQGHPCTNCKNAGVESCQFLRVSSREAPLRHENGEFVYSVGDARAYASRTPVTHGLPYPHDLPGLNSGDGLGSYRGPGSGYPYTPATKAYYPAMHAYGAPYPDDFEFGLGVASPPVMHPESVGMMPGHWSSGGPRAKAPVFGSMYMESEGTYGGYGGSGLLHRPSHSAASDSPNFSFSGVAASLPLSSTPGPDRLLPNPAGRSSTLPYPGPIKPPPPTSSLAASTLADVATAASYAGGFETNGLSFSSATSSSLSSHPSSSSRSNSDSYSGPESLFNEQERGLQSQGSAFDMGGYTTSPRRSSGVGGSGNGHGYVPGESSHEAAAHHHASSQHHMPSNYMSDSPSSPIAHRHGQALASGSSASHAAHTDDRHVAVASRH
ncbi:hypothetical protein F5144DRAFT_483935 [Chaetomium tenue]|uniref:Uncharacterized protein n=1 Tax=Chaetomium tenue TaxID=1854479 RepID=A0ACB7PLQ6_9PEZI|nr:hypothetical protein F5144DRAFT_483935 [Chaetomium globosum]